MLQDGFTPFRMFEKISQRLKVMAMGLSSTVDDHSSEFY